MNPKGKEKATEGGYSKGGKKRCRGRNKKIRTLGKDREVR